MHSERTARAARGAEGRARQRRSGVGAGAIIGVYAGTMDDYSGAKEDQREGLGAGLGAGRVVEPKLHRGTVITSGAGRLRFVTGCGGPMRNIPAEQANRQPSPQPARTSPSPSPSPSPSSSRTLALALPPTHRLGRVPTTRTPHRGSPAVPSQRAHLPAVSPQAHRHGNSQARSAASRAGRRVRGKRESAP